MQNFMLKCFEHTSNLNKNHYLMVKTAKNNNFSIVNVCARILKQFLKSLTSYGNYMKF